MKTLILTLLLVLYSLGYVKILLSAIDIGFMKSEKWYVSIGLFMLLFFYPALLLLTLLSNKNKNGNESTKH